MRKGRPAQTNAANSSVFEDRHCVREGCVSWTSIHAALLPSEKIEKTFWNCRCFAKLSSTCIFTSATLHLHMRFLVPTCTHTILYLSIYLSVCLSIYLSVCLSIYLSVCLSPSLPPCLPPSLPPSVCLPVCLPVCLCLSLSVSVCLCLSLSVSVSVCLCLSLSVSVCPSVCLSLCLSIYLYGPAALHLQIFMW